MLKSADIEKALKAQKKKDATIRWLIITAALLVAAAVVVIVLIKTVFPIIRIEGSSMEQTFYQNELLLASKNGKISRGDIIVFDYEGKTVIKRVIAVAGDTVDMDEDGNVSVNGELLDESYVYEKSIEPCEIEFPLTVGPGCVFVLGDHRAVSIDSRTFGCIKLESVTGKVILQMFPVTKIGNDFN